MKNAQIIFSTGQDPDSIEILINGELTIQNVPDFKERIMGLAANKANIEIIADEVTSMDLPFYQLMLSMKKSFEQSSKRFTIIYRLPDDLEKLFINSGLYLNSNNSNI